MEKTLSFINIILVTAILAFVGLGVQMWVVQPETVQPPVIGSIPAYEKLPGYRTPYPPETPGKVNEKNLFRKERAEYVPPPPPPPPPPAEPPKPQIPPPSLKLSGTIISGAKKFAVLEGTFSTLANNKIESNKLKKKGYMLSAKIGTYTLTEIDAKSVTLDNGEGSVIKVQQVDDREEKFRIKRTGNHFFHKGDKPAPPPPPAAPAPNQPPAALGGPAPASGAPGQAPAAQPPAYKSPVEMFWEMSGIKVKP